MIIRFVGVNITLLEGYFHRFLVPTTGGPCERRITGINAILLADIAAFHLHITKDNLDDVKNRCPA